METVQKMDSYTDTFNSNDDDMAKAKERFIKTYSEESFNKNIQPFIGKGLMSIFNTEPTNEIGYYLVNLAYYVNVRLYG